LESLRAGRTRYLVVVSRPASKVKPQNSQVPDSSNKSPDMTTKSTDPSTTATSHSNPNPPCSINVENQNSYLNNFSDIKQIINDNNKKNCDENLKLEIMKVDENEQFDNFSDNDVLSELNSKNIYDSADYLHDVKQGNSANPNEIEESCLLGIDCNEKTTVGLVLKVMADTAIRLDGDG
jgi:hypothetical protein